MSARLSLAHPGRQPLARAGALAALNAAAGANTVSAQIPQSGYGPNTGIGVPTVWVGACVCTTAVTGRTR